MPVREKKNTQDVGRKEVTCRRGGVHTHVFVRCTCKNTFDKKASIFWAGNFDLNTTKLDKFGWGRAHFGDKINNWRNDLIFSPKVNSLLSKTGDHFIKQTSLPRQTTQKMGWTRSLSVLPHYLHVPCSNAHCMSGASLIAHEYF